MLGSLVAGGRACRGVSWEYGGGHSRRAEPGGEARDDGGGGHDCALLCATRSQEVSKTQSGGSVNVTDGKSQCSSTWVSLVPACASMRRYRRRRQETSAACATQQATEAARPGCSLRPCWVLALPRTYTQAACRAPAAGRTGKLSHPWRR